MSLSILLWGKTGQINIIYLLMKPRLGHSLKIGDGGAWIHWSPPFFFFNSLSPNDPFFLIIHNQFWTISYQMTQFIGNILSNLKFFRMFWSKMCPKSYFAQKIYHNLSYSHRLTPGFSIFSLNDPLLRRKISH